MLPSWGTAVRFRILEVFFGPSEWPGEGGASGPPESREWTGNRVFLTQNKLEELERFLSRENAGGRQYFDSTPTGTGEGARM